MMRKQQMALVALLILCGALTACSRNSDSYFPLSKGAHWEYKVLQRQGTNETVSQLDIDADGTVDIGTQKASIRRASTGHMWAIATDAAGIKRVASRREVDDEFTKDMDSRFVLKAPFTVGSNWSATTVPYLLARKGEFPPELIHAHQTSMTYTIASVDESITTAAGVFADCLRVDAVGVLRLYVDPVIGVTDVPLTGQEWYCKSIGLVKLTRIEKIASPFLTGGEYSMELTRYTF
jgi:predicted small lipoprotein YifL